MLRKLLFVNFKLAYYVSQWSRKRFTANGLLILLIMPIAGVFGIDTRSTLSFQIFSITLILLLLAMSYTFFFRGRYAVQRHLPDYATVDTPLHYSCTVNNLNNKAKRELIIIDNLQTPFPSIEMYKKAYDPLAKKRNRVDRFIGYPKLINLLQHLRGASISPASISYIAESSQYNVNIELLPKRRGYIHFDAVSLAQADPLGLFQAYKTYKTKQKLLVLPKMYPIPNLQLENKRTYQPGGINNATSVGDSQEFISLRDYRPGDPMKSIHWRSFAKTGKPIVKEYQDEFFVRYGLILDTYLGQQADYLFEDAVSIAASSLSRPGDQDALLDLMFIGNTTYHFTAGRGLLSIRDMLEILACIKPDRNSNIAELLGLVRAHVKSCSALVYVMLEIDATRVSLLNQLQTYGIPLKVLLLTDKDTVPDLEELDVDIQLIRHENLPADLKQLL